MSLSVYPQAKQQLNPVEDDCLICLSTENGKNNTFMLTCEHTFHKQCLIRQLQFTIQSGSVMKCSHCNKEPSILEICNLLEQTGRFELIEKYKKIIQRKNRNDDKTWVGCPMNNCDGGNEINQQMEGFLRCTKCNTEYCTSCTALKRIHLGLTCEELDKKAQIEIKLKSCPECGVRTEKEEGCDHVTCENCKKEWCYRCGKHFEVGHMKNSHYDEGLRSLAIQQILLNRSKVLQVQQLINSNPSTSLSSTPSSSSSSSTPSSSSSSTSSSSSSTSSSSSSSTLSSTTSLPSSISNSNGKRIMMTNPNIPQNKLIDIVNQQQRTVKRVKLLIRNKETGELRYEDAIYVSSIPTGIT